MLPIDNHLHMENHEAVLTGIVVDSDICQTTSLLLVSEMLLFQIMTSPAQEKRSGTLPRYATAVTSGTLPRYVIF